MLCSLLKAARRAHGGRRWLTGGALFLLGCAPLPSKVAPAGAAPDSGGSSTTHDTAERTSSPPDSGTVPAAPLAAEVGLRAVTAPLVAVLDVSAEVPVTVQVNLTGPQGERTLEVAVPASNHALPLVGFWPATRTSVEVVLQAADGRKYTAEAWFEAPALPDDFPSMELHSAPGDQLVLFAPFRPEGGGWLAVVDGHGRVVWALDAGRDVRAVTGRPGGVQGLWGDALGDLGWDGEFRAYYAQGGSPPIAATRLHHEARRLPDGGWLTLENQVRRVESFPLDYGLKAWGRALVVDPVVLRLAADGSTVGRWSLGDRLDLTRIGFDSLNLLDTAYDWGHANAVWPVDGGFVVSLRHQDAVVRLDEASGEVRWILAPPEGWSEELAPLLLQAEGALLWPNHAHAPSLDSEGRLLLFDNRNNGGSSPYQPSAGPQRSRLVEYTIDEVARTVRQTWVWEDTPAGPLYSFALGNAERGPGGVLATFARLQEEDGQLNLDRERGQSSVRIFLVDPATDAVSWDLGVWGPLESAPGGWQLDRAVRLAGFYGPEVLDSGWR